ncbi:MAG: permease [Candidatus Hermodarchaeia archaeon]
MKSKPKRDYTQMFLLLVAIVLGVVSYQIGGISLALGGLISGGNFLLSVLLLLIAAFLTAGLIQALVSEEMVSRWLGTKSGWRGIALACLGGALIPGGPYVYYPIAGALLNTGAGIGVLVAFIAAKNLWSISRIPMEIALLGPELTLIRYGITFLIPPVLGFLAETLFGRSIGRIREGITS